MNYEIAATNDADKLHLDALRYDNVFRVSFIPDKISPQNW
jgi:hypothetical protein